MAVCILPTNPFLNKHNRPKKKLNMQICVKCKKEMICVKTGCSARWNEGQHVYRGDKFQCSECKSTIMVCNSTPGFDPTPRVGEHDVIMDDWEPPQPPLGKDRPGINMRRKNEEQKNTSSNNTIPDEER